MKSFKYKGTPEQMAKVAEWALKNGARWYCDDDEREPGDDGIAYCGDCEGDNDLLYINFYDVANEPVLELTPALELEIFGKTAESLITEDSWKENTGVPPDLPKGTLVDTKWENGLLPDQLDHYVDEWEWDIGLGITHWRFHKLEDAKYYVQPATSIGELLKPKFLAGEEYSKAPTTPKKPMCLEDAYDQPEYTDDYKMDMKIATTTGGKIKSDGGPTDYYELTIKNKQGDVLKCQVGDVIRAMVGNDFDLGNVIKATRRIWCDVQGYGKEGIDMQYDVKKINYFTNEFYEANK